MINTTLCYIEKNDSYLLLHRTKKEHDFNKDKWIGVGGKFEDGESPEECLLREVKEETGLTLRSWHWHGIVTFVSDEYPTEYMYLYTSSDFTGELSDCDEGELEWVPRAKIFSLPLWPGDRIFLRLMQEGEPVLLAEAQLSGRPADFGGAQSQGAQRGGDRISQPYFRIKKVSLSSFMAFGTPFLSFSILSFSV